VPGRWAGGKVRALKSAVSLFILLLGLWLAASGHYTTLLITFGVLSCAGVVTLCWRMKIVDAEGMPVHLLGRALLYIPWITYQVLIANIDVARRVLFPKANVTPQLFEVPTSQKTDLGRVLYANSITLTPGTVSIIVFPDRIKVHAISKQGADSLHEGEMDRQVTRMEGLSN
jgi:multicomponent Na+:H+ antiporter subunit E